MSTKRKSNLLRRTLGVGLLGALLALTSGCNWITAGSILLAPKQVAKAEFKLTDQRLAIFIDYAKPEQEYPVFDRTLYDQITTVFRDQVKYVPSTVVPFKELVDLRRANGDFRTWSVQRIGRELNADQVLYIRVDELQLRPAPDHPLLEPAVALSVKVIGVPDPSEQARLWPDDAKGRAVKCQRMAEEAASVDAQDAAAAKLAREAGREVAKPFYDVDTEEKAPKES